MPAKNPAGQASLDSANENMLVIVGRLLAATEAASDGIKTLSEESKITSVGVQASQQAIQAAQKTLADLDRIVRTGTGNGDSLITQIKLLCDEQLRLREDLDELRGTSAGNTRRLDSYDHRLAGTAGGHKVLWYILAGIAWAVTTGIAISGLFMGR